MKASKNGSNKRERRHFTGQQKVAMDNLADLSWLDAYLDSEPVLTDFQRPEEVLKEDFAGVDGVALSGHVLGS